MATHGIRFRLQPCAVPLRPRPHAHNVALQQRSVSTWRTRPWDGKLLRDKDTPDNPHLSRAIRVISRTLSRLLKYGGAAAVYGTALYFAAAWARDASIERKFAATSPMDLADPYGWLSECSLLNYGFGSRHTAGTEATDPRMSKATRKAARAAWALRTIESVEKAIELAKDEGFDANDPAVRELYFHLAARLSASAPPRTTFDDLERAREIYTDLYTLGHSLPPTTTSQRQQAFCARAIIDLSVRLTAFTTPDQVERADLRLLLAPLLTHALSHALGDAALRDEGVIPAEPTAMQPLSSSSQHAWLLSRWFRRRPEPVNEQNPLILRLESIQSLALVHPAQVRDLASTLSTTIALWAMLGNVAPAAQLASRSLKLLDRIGADPASQEQALHQHWLRTRRALLSIYAAELSLIPDQRLEFLRQAESAARFSSTALDKLPALAEPKAEAICKAVKDTIARDASNVGSLAAMTIGLSHTRTDELDAAEAAFKHVKVFAARGNQKASGDMMPKLRDLDQSAWQAAHEQIEAIRELCREQVTTSEGTLPGRKLIWEIDTWAEMKQWLDELDRRNIARIKRLFGMSV